MKKLLIMVVALLLVSGCSTHPAEDPNADIAQFKVDTESIDIASLPVAMTSPMKTIYFEDMDHADSSSDFIIEGQVKDTYQVIYQNLPFYIAEIKVKDTLKGEVADTIFVLETGGIYRPRIKRYVDGVSWYEEGELTYASLSGRLMLKGDKVVLFLEEFEGGQEEMFGRDMYSTFAGEGKFFLTDEGKAVKVETLIWTEKKVYTMDEFRNKLKKIKDKHKKD